MSRAQRIIVGLVGRMSTTSACPELPEDSAWVTSEREYDIAGHTAKLRVPDPVNSMPPAATAPTPSIAPPFLERR